MVLSRKRNPSIRILQRLEAGMGMALNLEFLPELVGTTAKR